MCAQPTPATDSVSTDDIREVAKLARLGIDATTASSFANDIDKILTIMQTISTVDTEELAPLANIHEACQELRPDIADAEIDREQNQSMAPAVAEGLYLVPQVIE